MTTKPRKPSDRPIAVRCLDPRTGRSLSFTVYPFESDSLEPVAVAAREGVRLRWARVTDLADRRHKRR